MCTRHVFVGGQMGYSTSHAHICSIYHFLLTFSYISRNYMATSTKILRYPASLMQSHLESCLRDPWRWPLGNLEHIHASCSSLQIGSLIHGSRDIPSEVKATTLSALLLAGTSHLNCFQSCISQLLLPRESPQHTKWLWMRNSFAPSLFWFCRGK